MAASRPRDRKAQIARAAQELFHERGYHRVGVDMVAAEVGIGGSAIYRHCAGKQDLLARVVLDGLERFGAAVGKATSGGRGVEDVLVALVPSMIDERTAPALWQREVRHMRPAEQAEVRTGLDAIEDQLVRGLEAHEPVDAPLLRARAALSVLWSPSYTHATPPRPEFEELLVDLTAAVWRCPLPEGERASTATGAAPPPRPARASRREAILEVASEMFAERGFAEVSLQEVGATLGVTGASVYRHFATKADLLYAALVRGAEGLNLAMSRALAAPAEPVEALCRVLGSYVDVMLEHRSITQLLVTEVMNLPDEAQATIRRSQLDYVAEWVQLLSRSRPGIRAEAARVVVQAALSVINDLLRRERHRGGRGLREDAVALGCAVIRAA